MLCLVAQFKTEKWFDVVHHERRTKYPERSFGSLEVQRKRVISAFRLQREVQADKGFENSQFPCALWTKTTGKCRLMQHPKTLKRVQSSNPPTQRPIGSCNSNRRSDSMMYILTFKKVPCAICRPHNSQLWTKYDSLNVSLGFYFPPCLLSSGPSKANKGSRAQSTKYRS